MKYLTLVLALLFFSIAYSQESRAPRQVTLDIEKAIKANIEKDVVQLRDKLAKQGTNKESVEFQADTLRIERYMDQYIQYDYSTVGMRTAANDAAEKYDTLLNKYYQKLLATLKPEDKPALVHAEKAWIVFKDKELALQSVLSKDEYSGGGTIQQLISSSFYLEIIKQRAITLYNLYSSGWEN